MGISTTQSYRGAQIFEAIGLAQDVIDKYFTWTPVARGWRRPRCRSRGRLRIVTTTRSRWRKISTAISTSAGSTSGVAPASSTCTTEHDRAPAAFGALGKLPAVQGIYKAVDEQSRSLATLRSLLKFNSSRPPVPLEEVERPPRSSSASRPARCHSDRSARKRTKISPSR